MKNVILILKLKDIIIIKSKLIFFFENYFKIDNYDQKYNLQKPIVNILNYFKSL